MNKTILRVIEQKDFDRYVFITYENDEIIGLNFHQGIGEVDYYYSKPCVHLTEIFKRLKRSAEYGKQSPHTRIDKAIELYTNAFIFQDSENAIQVQYIKEALQDIINQLN